MSHEPTLAVRRTLGLTEQEHAALELADALRDRVRRERRTVRRLAEFLAKRGDAASVAHRQLTN